MAMKHNIIDLNPTNHQLKNDSFVFTNECSKAGGVAHEGTSNQQIRKNFYVSD